MTVSLVRPLFDGAVDILADVHGEIQALLDLLKHLGYHEDGTHPDGRRLVFLGDLTDRGPDSPAVVALVQRLVDAGLAQAVLGNHELNILLGEEKPPDNNWFFGKEGRHAGMLFPQKLIQDDETRGKVKAFFAGLPLVLERPGLRVVHACWQAEMVDVARQETDVLDLYHRYVGLIESNASKADEIDLQNQNPVKLLTSGPERRVPTFPDFHGKMRNQERVPWWNDYTDPQYVVFGHYAAFPGEPHGHGRAICLDYGVAKRHRERLESGFNGTFRGKLAVLRGCLSSMMGRWSRSGDDVKTTAFSNP